MGERLAAPTRAVPKAILPVLLSFLIALVWTTSASAAVTQKQAAARAVDALGADQGSEALIVFGLPKPVKAGTKITQAGTSKPSKGATKGLSAKLRRAGVRLVKAPRVLTARTRSYFFYEDQGPYQLYQHPGRVVLVDVASGKATVSKTITWPPLVNGRLPAFLKSAGAYRSSKYQVLNRPYTVQGATQQPRPLNRNLFDQDPFGPGRPLPSKTNSKLIANRLAAERSCALRVTDTLPSFWNANELNLTRSYVGTLFEQLERDNGGFVDDRYGARSGESLGQSVDRLITAGCKDILLYIAGQGYSSGGEPVIHLGTSVRRGGMIAQQNIAASDLAKLVADRSGTTFKFKIDAPYAGGMIDVLKPLPNVLLVETPSAAGDEAYAFVPQVENQDGQMVTSTPNPAGLLEFTNCELMGLKAFFDSMTEIDKATQGQEEGVSFLVEMLARAQELCNGEGGFADDLGAAPQLYAQKRASGNGTNQPPKADKQDVTVTEDTPKSITLTGSDPDGDPLTFSITKQPDHGTLSGSGPNVTYTPDADYTGKDDFSFKVDDGKGASNTAKVDITVVEGNDPAVVTTSAGNTAYTEDAASVVVDGSLTVSDPDDTQLESAEVRVHGDDFQPGDELSFVNTPTITGFYDTNTGALFLTGTASVADYQAALRSVRFRTTNDNAKTPKRIEFRADDGDGLGPIATKNMAIANVNDAPTVDASDATLAYTEGDGAVAVDSLFSVSDPDTENLSGATLDAGPSWIPGEDELTWVDNDPSDGITLGSDVDGTGVLTLTGTGTVNEYADAIRAVTYTNSSENPDTTDRTVAFTVTDAGTPQLSSNTDTRTISVARVNDAPVVNTSAGNTSYTEGDPGTVVDGALTVSDVDDTNIESAQVRISSGFESGDDLTFVNTANITGTYNTGTGVLTLSGTDTVANYQAALRSITFDNTVDDDLNPTKVIEFKVNDGSLDSNLASKNIAVTPVNDNPTIDTSDTALSYTEGDGAVAIDTGITITDPDSANLAGATVDAADASWVPAEDQLVWTDNDAGDGITLGSYNDTTGVLTLTGTGTIAQYVAALEAVQYQNSSDNPSTTTRTIGFQVDDGGAVDNLSNIATRDITVSRVNDAPTVTTSAGDTSYTEGGAATAVDGSLTVSDPDDTSLESAEVRISNNFESGDNLIFVDQNGITGNYNNGTGVLTLSGTASVSDYQTALRSITYSNTTDDNLASPKTVSFEVNDGDADSNTATKNIAITPVNDAPTVNTSAGDTAYTENDPATAIDAALTVSDPDDTNLETAQVRISSGFQSGDQLVFVDTANITGTYNSGTGVLTLNGTDTVANYQAALRSVQYQTTSENPSSPKTIEFKVNDGDTDSNLATKNVVVTPANDAPVVSTSNGSTSYTEGDPATTVDGGLTVSDADDTNLEAATVTISNGFQSGDSLVFVDQNGISGTYNTGTGVLTLTGTASVSDYQTALRSVQFQTTNDNPSGKTIEFKVNDGSLDSAAAFKTINITGQNDGPTITTTASTHSYTEGQGAQPVDPGLLLTDPENDQISGATVKISSGFVQAEDDLVFVDQNGITGSYDDTQGELTLSGTASVADYQTALRSVAYQNTSDDPNNTTRTVSFQATDAGTPNQASNTATRDVSVADANDAPVVNTSAGSTSYTEGDPATTVDGALTVTDVDDTNLEGGQVRISSGFQSGDDLVFVNQNGISGVYNSGTGVLTLTGTASKADYQTALRSIQFQTTNDAPVTSKTVEFKVNDGDVDSNLATKNLAITPANDAPTLNTSGGSASFVEDSSGPVAVDPNLTLTDPDSTNIQGATVEITTGFDNTEDQLVFVDTANITGVYNSGTGVLTLSGTDTVANYQAALRSVQYNNTDTVGPSTATRTVRFQATDDGGAPSNFATRDVTVAQSNDAPVVNTSAGDTAYTEGDPATTVDGALTVTDPEDTNLEGGQVRISSGFQSGDDLVFVNQNGISGVYNSGTGVLTLTGTASVADYQTALRSIQFQTTNDAPVTSKTVEFKVNDGDVDSNLATKNLAITPTNDAPTLNTSAGNATFTEDLTGPVAVDPNLTLTDPDSTNIQGATVEITTGFNNTEDQLVFVDTANITGVYNSSTGVLTLSGTDTVANYQAALRSVQYNNTDTVAPDTTQRTVRFQATDDGGAPSNFATRNVTINSVNDAPVVTTTAGSTPYTEDDPATTIDGGLTVSDQDDTNLEGGQVRISSGFQSGDSLVFVNQNGISGVYNTGTGVLTLTGTASVADYQTALRSIQFQSTQQQPVTSKTVEFKVNDGDTDSNLATKELAVTPTNDAPIVNATDTALTYTENDPATAVDSGLTIDDTENDNLSGGSASITANYQAGQDFLAWSDNNLADNITLDGVNSNAQTVVLTGLDSEANYQAALRAVTYQNGSENPSNVARTVTFSATDQPGLTGSDTRTINVTPVDDPPDAVNDSATVLEDASATSIPVLTNDTDIDGGPKTISSATDPANGTVVLTGGSPGQHTGLTYEPDPNYCNDPPGTTPDTFQYTLNGGDTAFVSMTVTCVNDAPVADDETFNGANAAVGNTTHLVNDPTDGAPAVGDPTDTNTREDRPHKAITGDILAGDTDIDGPGPLTVTPGTFATNDGGSVTIESDGDFTFEPAPATSCTDTSDFFDYTVEDSDPGNEQTDTGRVTIEISGCVWYVNNHDVQGNSGTSQRPFDSTSQAVTASGSGHFIYVYDGNNSSLQYPGVAMKQNQSLVGEAADLVVGGHTLQQEDNARRPQLADTVADVVALDDNNTVTGIEVDPAGAFSGIAGGSGDTGGGTIADVRIIDTGVAATNAGLELISTTGTFNVSDLEVNNLAALGQNGSSKGVELSSAGTVNFAPTGTISLTTTGGAGLSAISTNLGTSTFDTITTSNSSTGGVELVNTTNPVGGSTTFGDLSLTTTSGSVGAFDVSSGGTIVVPSGGSANAQATGGPGVDVTSTTGAQLNFDNVSSTNSSGAGINLSGLGSGVFNASSGTISGAAGISFDLNDGDGAITYPGNLNNGSGPHAIQITSRDGGAVTISGPLSDTNDAGGGIDLSSNTGGSTTISNATKQINTTGGASAPTNQGVVMTGPDNHTLILSGGGLDIDTTNGKGLEAENSGTIEVSGTGNTIDTTTGRGLNISDTDIANNDVTFQRISSNGASNGIRLNNTGNANGRLLLTGNGGTCSSAATCTGGGIQNSTTSGVFLNNVPGGAEFMRLAVTDSADHGIDATTVGNGILLDRAFINSNGNAVADNGVDYENVTGVTAIRHSDVIGSGVLNDGGNNVRIALTSGTLHLTYNDNDSNLASTDDGLHIRNDGTGTIRSSITGNRFDDNKGAGIQVADGASTGVTSDHTITGNTVDGKAGTSTDSGIPISTDGSARVNVSSNTITNPSLSALVLNPLGTSGATTFDGTANSNSIGTAAANSGSDDGDGIQLKSATEGTAEVAINSNTIRNYGQKGMWLRASESTGGNTQLTAQGNQISQPDAATWETGIYLQAGSSSTDVLTFCADVGGAGTQNTFTPIAPSPATFADFTLDLRFANSVLRLPGYSGTTLANRQAYFLGRNTGFVTFAQDGTQNPQNNPTGCTQPTSPNSPTAPPAVAP